MEAIEALRHIYKDGCKTIRPRDKWIIASQSPPLLPSSRRHRHKENKIATNSLIQWANIEDNSPKEPNASSTLKEKGVSEIDVGDLTINKSRKTNKFLDEPEDSNIKAVTSVTNEPRSSKKERLSEEGEKKAARSVPQSNSCRPSLA
ncbi:hypothetical protein V6N11_028340 [Hibiscus sabdariffa]|uniref:Uncharacterized protein n=1 Tax=Hibiscus sabdariffa TaxID=183260 RepID=A0ABR2NQA8_9ROSI